MPSDVLPRLPFEEFPDDLRSLLEPRVVRLGYLGEFFRCSAHQPEALTHFIGFTESLKAALPATIVEVIALTCASVLGNDYERNQHHRLCMALGLGETFISLVEAGCDGEPLVDDPLATCQRYVVAACRPGTDDVEHRFSDMSRLLGADQAVAVTLTAARYVAHALVVRSFGLDPPVPPLDRSSP